MTIITNSSNPTIKRIRALKNRRDRDESGLYFIEGVRIVGEAVQLNAPLDSLVVAPELLTSPFGHEVVAEQRKRSVPVIEVTAAIFENLSAKDGPQGLGAVVRQRWERLDQVRLEAGLGWVALDAAQDPGNIGTIMRTADAVGAAGIILTGNSADPYDPSAVRASMGALYSLRLVRASFDDFAAWKLRHGYTVIGTSDRAAQDYQAIRYAPPLILLMGSERQGLAPNQMAMCDTMAKIPMVGRSDSLNLAVATGVMLYEIFNQQRRQG
ncbi:MAG: RNA methyltransferase [Anaerolineae bacterium]|nr:RNA methyltransferase [Anaerolineae bacterium]